MKISTFLIILTGGLGLVLALVAFNLYQQTSPHVEASANGAVVSFDQIVDCPPERRYINVSDFRVGSKTFSRQAKDAKLETWLELLPTDTDSNDDLWFAVIRETQSKTKSSKITNAGQLSGWIGTIRLEDCPKPLAKYCESGNLSIIREAPAPNYSTVVCTGLISLVYFSAIPIILFFRFRTAKIDKQSTAKDFSEVRIFADKPLEEVPPNRLLNQVQGVLLKYHKLTHVLLAGAMCCIGAIKWGEFQGVSCFFETETTWTCLAVGLFLAWLITNFLIYFIGSIKSEFFLEEISAETVSAPALELYQSVEADPFGKTMTLLGDAQVQHAGTHHIRYYLPEVPLAVVEVGMFLGKPVIGFTSITLEGVAITTGPLSELLDYRELGIPSVQVCCPPEAKSLEEKYHFHLHIVQQTLSDQYTTPLLISPSHVAHVFEYTHRLTNWIKHKAAFATGGPPKLLPNRGEIATKINNLWWFNWSVRSDLRNVFADIKMDRTQFEASAQAETDLESSHPLTAQRF